jgi:hypothetical protein
MGGSGRGSLRVGQRVADADAGDAGHRDDVAGLTWASGVRCKLRKE